MSAPPAPATTLTLDALSLHDNGIPHPPPSVLAAAWDVFLISLQLVSLLPPSDLASLAATNKAFQPFRFQHWHTQDKTMPERERQAWWVCLTSQRLSPYLETEELCLSLAVTAKPFRAFGRQPVR